MNVYRILFAAIALVSLVTPAFAQVAVDRSSPSSQAPPVIKVQPAPVVEVQPEATPSETPEPTPKKKKPKPAETPATQERTQEKITAKSLGMTQQEFQEAGLDKLSQTELQSLAASMRGYRQTVEMKASERANAQVKEEVKKQAKQRIDTVDSRVDGTITRLTGHSIIKLEDGTVWKQAMSEDRYPAQVSDHPSAHVFHSAWGWKMRIAGLPDFYVDPIRD
jgi:hypothetical protein